MNLCASPASPSWYPATPRNRSPCPLSPLPQDDEPLLLLYSPLFLGLSLCLCASVVNSCFPNSEEFCVNSANLPSLPAAWRSLRGSPEGGRHRRGSRAGFPCRTVRYARRAPD